MGPGGSLNSPDLSLTHQAQRSYRWSLVLMMVSVRPYVHKSISNIKKQTNDRLCRCAWWVTEFTRIFFFCRINKELKDGITEDPNRPGCSSAPMCEEFIHTTPEPTTTTTTIATTTTATTTTATTTTATATPPTSECEVNKCARYPGDCHRYFACRDNGSGGLVWMDFNCGDMVFSPYTCDCISKCDPVSLAECGSRPPECDSPQKSHFLH